MVKGSRVGADKCGGLRGALETTAGGSSASGKDLDGEGDALAAADTEGDNAALEPIPAHRMDQAGREYGSSRANRMAVGDCAALRVDNALRQAKFAHNGDHDCSKRLVDLDPLDISDFPSGPLEGLAHCRDWPEAEHARLDGGNAI